MALSRLAAAAAVFCSLASLANVAHVAHAQTQKGGTHELSAVREGLKAQSALMSEDEAKAAAVLEEIRAIDARLLDAARSQG
ncbi:MAG TPA: hypothetical protein VFO62_06705, partial [Candidatus Binatia bacterium]|nr:hypothetical protein [Candidatus Binatia bacterium]